MADVEYKIKFDADASGAKKGFSELANSASKAASKITSAMNNIEKSVLSGFGTALKAPGKALMGMASSFTKVLKGVLIGGGAALVGAAYKGIEAANDLNDAIAITDAAYGENAAEMHEWAKESASAYGLARTQAEKYFGSIGEYLKNAGVSSDQSAIIAKNMAAKSGELSRAYGVSSDKAMEQLTKGVQTGEGRGLRQYGVILSEDAYNQELLAEGINKAYSELSAEDQYVVRYNTLMKQLGDVTGATAGEFSNWEGAVAGLVSNTKDALATFGQIIQAYLLPVVQLLARIMQSVSAALSNLLGTLGVETGQASAVEDYSEAIEDLGKATQKTGSQAKKASGGLASFDKLNNMTQGSGAGSGATAIKNNAKAMDLLGKSAKNNIKPLKQWLEEFMNADWESAGYNLGEKINGVLGKLQSLGDWLTTNNIGEKIGKWLKGLTDAKVWENAGKTAVSLVDNLIVTPIGETFKTAPMYDIGKQMIGGIVSGLQEHGDHIGEELSNILKGAADWIIGFFDPDEMAKLGVSLGNIFNKLGEKGANGEASAISKVAEALTTMILGIISFITNFVSTVDWGNLAFEILNGIGEAIKKNPTPFFEGLAIILAWNIAKQTIGTAVSTLGGDIGSAMGSGAGLAFKSTLLAAIIAFKEGAELKQQIKETKDIWEGAAHEITSYDASAENITYTGEISESTAGKLDQFSEKLTTAWDRYHDAMAGLTHNEAGDIDLENNRNLQNMKAANEYIGDIVKAADEYGFKSDKVQEMADAYAAFKGLDLTYASEFAGHELWTITGSKKKDLQEGAALLGTSGIALEQFVSDMNEFVTSGNNPVDQYNASLDSLVDVSKKDVQPELDTDKEKMDNFALSAGDAALAVGVLGNTDIPKLTEELKNSVEPLDSFLERMNKISELKHEGKFIDLEALQTNMNEAYRIVDDAVKKIDKAIADSTNLKNFETTLSSTQTIKVDTSGKFGVTVDAKAHIDSSELVSWYDEFTMGNKNSRG